MKKAMLLTLVLVTLARSTSLGQEVHNLPTETWEDLNRRDWETKYFAIMSLKSESELSKEVVDLLISCLSDLRGEFPGNTVAGKSAEVLAKHPKHAARALPELLKLLAYTEKYGYPAGSAAEAIRVVKRKELERYIKGLDREKRKALCESLIPPLDLGVGSIPGHATTAMMVGMLGETKVIPVLEKRLKVAKEQEGKNSIFRRVRVRAEAALKILGSKCEIGDSEYLKAMKEADALIGMPDQYLEPGDMFSYMLEKLHTRMQKGGAKTAYILRLDLIPFDNVSNGVPRATLSFDGRWHFLFTRSYENLAIPTKSQIIILTEVSRKGYSEDFVPGGTPAYCPKAPDYAFMRLGVNGEAPLDNFLKELLIKGGYRQDVWYEFWPTEWWVGINRCLSYELPKAQKFQWVQVENGRISQYAGN